MPHLVAALIFVLLLGQSGLLARALHAAGVADAQGVLPALVYDPRGIGFVLALAWKELPFLALLAFSVLATRGPGLEETARSLGAGSGAVFRRVTWPVLLSMTRPPVSMMERESGCQAGCPHRSFRKRNSDRRRS